MMGPVIFVPVLSVIVVAPPQVSHSRAGRNPFHSGFVVVVASPQVPRSRAGRNPFRSGFVVIVAPPRVSRSRAGCDPFGSGFHAAASLHSSGDSLARFNLRFIFGDTIGNDSKV